MHRDARNAIPVLLLTSAIDWPWHVLTERAWPVLPTAADLDRGRPGSWHHSGKDWWTEAMRADPQWWSKFWRFAVWWAIIAAAV